MFLLLLVFCLTRILLVRLMLPIVIMLLSLGLVEWMGVRRDRIRSLCGPSSATTPTATAATSVVISPRPTKTEQ